MIDYDSFSRCHLADIFFRFSRGSKRVNININSFMYSILASVYIIVIHSFVLPSILAA